jgi:hypothetical protein
MKDVFLQLIRLAIGTSYNTTLPKCIDWNAIEAFAKQNGLMGIMFDAVQEVKGLTGPS